MAASALGFSPRLLPMTPTQWPHREVGPVVDMVVAYQPAALTIPAFPRIGAPGLNRMSEGMPCLAVDRESQRVYFDTSDPARVEAELTTFYEHYLADDLDYFAISPEASPGLYETLEQLRTPEDYPRQSRPDPVGVPPIHRGRFISSSLNGPISFGMRTTDEQDRPIFYHEALRDAIIKTLGMKARWLHRALSQAAPGATVGGRFAEPLLSLYGTSFASLPRAEIMAALNQCLEAVPGPTTVHCCANIDWPLLFESATDIIHFDAYEFADKLALFPRELQAYLDRGGMVAWGIVPSNNDKLSGETVDSLVERFEQGLAAWEAHGLDRGQVVEASFIQPSCSLSTMTEDLAERAFHYTNEVSARLRARYFNG